MELGIKGHSTKGYEVIKILEMLGGKNCYNTVGNYDNNFYHINNHNEIVYSYIGPDEIKGYEIFSVEDFLKKFPYKVGDKVEFWSEVDYYGRTELETSEIISMRWNSARCEIAYRLKGESKEFYKSDIKCKVIDIAIKPTKKMEEKKINQMSLANCDLDEVEIVLGDRFELKIIDGKYYAVRKKPIYPITYVDCCKVIGCRAIIGFTGLDDEEENLYGKFIALKRCRDAYWKIAGEQMGLDKPWKPEIQDSIWGITRSKDEVEKYSCHFGKTHPLEFPTEEMRDAFFANFKDLIEQCKELL